MVSKSHILWVFAPGLWGARETPGCLNSCLQAPRGCPQPPASLSCVTTGWAPGPGPRGQKGRDGDPWEPAHVRQLFPRLRPPPAHAPQGGRAGGPSADRPAPPAGERPFHCTLCEKAFNQKSALQVHMKKHTGERPYRCPCCAMGFTQKSNMKLHMKRAHSYSGEAPSPPRFPPRPRPPAASAHVPEWSVSCVRERPAHCQCCTLSAGTGRGPLSQHAVPGACQVPGGPCEPEPPRWPRAPGPRSGSPSTDGASVSRRARSRCGGAGNVAASPPLSPPEAGRVPASANRG